MLFSLLSLSSSIKGISKNTPRPIIEANREYKICTKTVKVTDINLKWSVFLNNIGNSESEVRALNPGITELQWNTYPYGLTIKYKVACPQLSYIDYYNEAMSENYDSLSLSMCYMAYIRTNQEELCETKIKGAASYGFVNATGAGPYDELLAAYYNLYETYDHSDLWRRDTVYKFCRRSDGKTEHYVVNTRSYGMIDPSGKEQESDSFKDAWCIWLQKF